MPRHVIDIGPSGRRWGAGQAVEDRYRPMVADLEHLAQTRPAAYRRLVLWGALLGYAFILAVIVGMVGVALAGMWLVLAMRARDIAIGLVVILPLALGYLASALWIRFERPRGHKIKRHQAPELFALLDRVRHATKSPWVNQVLITQGFNAAIVQKPRLGVFGWPENYLLLGLPLLQALGPEEVTAVIAHEYGHLAGAHGTWAGWIYRTRQTWTRLGGVKHRGWLARLFQRFLVQRFLSWYGPWFNARTFVFARHNEYHADRCAADVAGAHHAASALTRVSVEGYRFARYWAGLQRLNRVQEAPRQLPFAGLSSYFMQPAVTRDHRLALNVALGEDTDIHDTHPCLADRLKALGEPMPELTPVTRNGAGAFLGDDLTARLIIAFDAAWWSEAQPAWQEAFEHTRIQRARLAELRDRPRPLDAEACWELVHLQQGFGDMAGAIAEAEAHLVPLGAPEALRVFLGRLLLEDGQARGILVLQPVLASRELGLRLIALRALTAYYDGFAPEAPERAIAENALAATEARQEIIREAFGRLDDGDVLTTAPLDPKQVARLRDIARAAPFVRALWVAQRVLPDDPGVAQYVALFLGAERSARADDKDSFMEAVLDVLGSHAYALVLEWDPEREWLRARLAATKGTQIYSDKRRVMKN